MVEIRMADPARTTAEHARSLISHTHPNLHCDARRRFPCRVQLAGTERRR